MCVLYCTYFSALLVSFHSAINCFCTCNKYNLYPCTDHHQSDIPLLLFLLLFLLLYPLPTHVKKWPKQSAEIRAEQSWGEQSRVDAERSVETPDTGIAGWLYAPSSKSKQSVIFKNVAQSSKNLSGYLGEMSKIAWVLYTLCVNSARKETRRSRSGSGSGSTVISLHSHRHAKHVDNALCCSRSLSNGECSEQHSEKNRWARVSRGSSNGDVSRGSSGSGKGSKPARDEERRGRGRAREQWQEEGELR